MDVLYSVNIEQFNNFLKQFKNDGEKVEKIINDYLHNTAPEKLKSKITDFVPVSDRNKIHARDSKPFGRQKNYNLAVKIITSKKFNYLVFPDEALGTSKINFAQNFTGRGLEAASPDLIEEMTAQITKNFMK